MADGKTNPTHDLWENDKEIYNNGQYFTEMVTDKAVEKIRSMNEDGQPFMMYVAYNAPTIPCMRRESIWTGLLICRRIAGSWPP